MLRPPISPHGRFACMLVVTVVTMLALVVGSAAAATCHGKHATIVGTPGDDVIAGKKASDVIYGGGGNDRISGGPNGERTIAVGACHPAAPRRRGLPAFIWD